MIMFSRTADISPGNIGSAVVFATEIAQLFEELTGVKLTLMTPVGGNPNQMIWRGTYENLGAMETAMETALASEAYHAKVASGTDLFIAGTVRDSIFKTVG